MKLLSILMLSIVSLLESNHTVNLTFVGDAMQHIGGNITQKLKKEAVDQAFIDLGFESMVCDGLPGYRAVRRMPKEIDALGRQMALRATQTQHADNKDPEIPDYF